MFVKNILFTVITVGLFFAGLELVLAVFDVRPVLLSEDPLVGFADNEPLFVAAAGLAEIEKAYVDFVYALAE